MVAAAAELPRIAIAAPEDETVIGRTTEGQMLIGVYWGYVALIEGLVTRLKAEIGRPVTVIATQVSPFCSTSTRRSTRSNPTSAIQGLALLAAGIKQ